MQTLCPTWQVERLFISCLLCICLCISFSLPLDLTHIELPAKLLDYFLWSNKSNILHSFTYIRMHIIYSYKHIHTYIHTHTHANTVQSKDSCSERDHRLRSGCAAGVVLFLIFRYGRTVKGVLLTHCVAVRLSLANVGDKRCAECYSTRSCVPHRRGRARSVELVFFLI